MAWRVAESLDTLLNQINDQFPKRSKKSDGSIGDAAHASRSSDHNPWIKAGGVGVVTARDYTHDPAGGLDCNWLADRLVASGDKRIKYVIWNRRIYTPGRGWAAYKGSNPHDKHLHLSVEESASLFDSTSPWALASKPVTAPVTNPTRDTNPEDCNVNENLLFTKLDQVADALRSNTAVQIAALSQAQLGNIKLDQVNDEVRKLVEASRTTQG